MELCKMAQEYRRNTALLEMINESRLAAFEMENYYEKEGEYVGRTAV